MFGPAEAAWRRLLAAPGRVSRAALAGVYVILTMQLLRGYSRRGDVRPLPRLYRDMTLLFCLCALACAGKALATGQRLLSAPSVLAVVFATAAASTLPRLSRARGTGAAAGVPVSVSIAPAPANAKAPCGFTAVRVETPEETALYTDWLLRNHEAIRELSAMLSAQELPSSAATATPARAGVRAGLRPSVPAGNATPGPF